MGIIDSFLRGMGFPGSKKARKGSSIPSLPDLGEIKEQAEKIIDNLSEIKDLPKTLMDRAVEAEEDFREADRAFRGTRLRKGGRKK